VGMQLAYAVEMWCNYIEVSLQTFISFPEPHSFSFFTRFFFGYPKRVTVLFARFFETLIFITKTEPTQTGPN